MEVPPKNEEKRQLRIAMVTMMMILAAISGGWGYWGMFTKEGNHKYDEMDGIYPFLGIAFAGLLTLISVILLIIPLFSRKR